MDARLSAAEVACVKKLAEQFEKNENWVNVGADPLELPPDKRGAILATMADLGLITEVTNAAGVPFFSFRITSKAVQAARAIHEVEAKKEEPRDIVEYIKNTARRNRILAWVVVSFFVVTALITLINQLLQLLTTLGLVKRS